MFDPTLTIESGIERLGEIVDGRAIELPADDPVLIRAQRSRRAVQILFDRMMVVTHGIWGFSLKRFADPDSAALYEEVKCGDDHHWILPLTPVRFQSSVGAYQAVREVILNAIEHGGARGISFRQLVGTSGELFVVAQGVPGPALEPILERQQTVGLSNYFSGKQLRGCGFRALAQCEDSIWYASPLGDSSYAFLIFAPADVELIDVQAPPPPDQFRIRWRPEPNTLDARLWNALVDCRAETADPRVYYANFFAAENLSLDAALAQMDPRVRELFEINVRGFLGEED